MFRKAKNTAVFGGNFTVVNEGVHEGLNGRQILSQSPYVVHGAIHNSGQRYPPSECHPGTREDVLKDILGWVDKPLDEGDSQIFWLSGPAGVGKTAIAQSLCQRLKELGRLAGDFFLSRSVAGHSDLHTLFPTLAYQLARAYPEFGLNLDKVIRSDESVLTKNMGIQLEQLIINPLKRASRKKTDIPPSPLVVVIDGLDEAGGERDQTQFLRLLVSAFIGLHLPLKIILTSRPEPWIKSAFGSKPLASSTRCHFLHRTSQTDKDIGRVLRSGFANIQATHDLMKSRSDRWPSSKVIDDIVDRASGQFIYVSTLLRYVEDPNGNPAERLRWIVKMPSQKFIDSPFLAIDNLYKHVLSTSSNVDRTLTILGAIIATFETRSAKYSRAFLRSLPVTDGGFTLNDGTPIRTISVPIPPLETVSFPIDRIERILNFRVADGFLALRTIQSLVDIPSSMELGVKFYHKSFQDFLLDSNRSGEYFIDMARVYYKFMAGTFRFLRNLEQPDPWSKQIHEDLLNIESRWMEWWLSSAASDQDWLLTEIKAIDKTAFYLNYTKRISQKIPFLFSKRHSGRLLRKLVEKRKSDGNIAELISREMTRETPFGLSLERFRSARTVLRRHLFRVHMRELN